MATNLFGITLGKSDEEKIIENETVKGDELFKTDNFVERAPSINILPDFVVKEYAAEALYKKVMAITVMLLVVTVGAFFGKAYLSGSNADRITSLEQQNTTLNNQVTELKPYETYFNSVDGKRAALYSKFAIDINYSKIFNTLQNPAASNSITGMTFSAFPGVATCQSQDPFNVSTDVGCITISASAPNGWTSVHAFSDTINSIEGFNNAYFPDLNLATADSGTGGTAASFSGYIGFTNGMFNYRYLPLSIPLFEMVNTNTKLVLDGDNLQTIREGTLDDEEVLPSPEPIPEPTVVPTPEPMLSPSPRPSVDPTVAPTQSADMN